MREFARGAVRLYILHYASTGEVYGAWLADEFGRHGYPISPGSLYPTLHHLEDEGLLRSRDRVVDGRARRSYEITDDGRHVLTVTKRQLRDLADEVLGSDKR